MSLTLNRLERPQIEVLANRFAGGRMLPPEVVEHVVQKTDGVPLFVEEMTKAVLASNVLGGGGIDVGICVARSPVGMSFI